MIVAMTEKSPPGLRRRFTRLRRKTERKRSAKSTSNDCVSQTAGGRLMLFILNVRSAKQPNAGLQLGCTISIQAEGKTILEKHAIAPSAARPCSAERD